MKKLVISILIALLLGGCAGPSTKILQSPIEDIPSQIKVEEIVKSKVEVEEVNLFYIQESMDYFTTRNEEESRDRVLRLLESYGYATQLQSQKGYDNVVAKKSGSGPGADIVVILENDNMETIGDGASSNVASKAVLLEVARLLANIPSDTEIWFVSTQSSDAEFDGVWSFLEEQATMSANRIVGCILLGNKNQPELVLGIQDDKPTALGNGMIPYTKLIQEEPWEYHTLENTISKMVMCAGIPTVSIEQKEKGFEYQTEYDTVDLIDIEQLGNVTTVLVQTLSRIMDEETASILAKSHYMNPLESGVAIQKPNEPILFSESLASNETKLGVRGTLLVNKDESSSYQYKVKWFEMEQAIDTTYYYKQNRLEEIQLNPQNSGITMEQMVAFLEECYGEATQDLTWIDTRLGYQLELISNVKTYSISITDYPVPDVEYAVYEIGSEEDRIYENKAVRESVTLLESWLETNEIDSITQIRIYSDGIGNTKGYISHDEGEIGIDLEDLAKEDGSFYYYEQTVGMLLDYCGILLENPKFKEETLFQNPIKRKEIELYGKS